MEGELEDSHGRTVKVVVLGDIGRSPRMQYHTLSLARSGLRVCIIGYADSRLLPDLEAHPSISVAPLHPLPVDRGPKIITYFLKALWQFFSLLITLLTTGHSDFVLCQNPPAIPTLPACWLYCFFTRTKFYIDWHNYAYTIMALSLKETHPLLKFSTWVEKYFGRKSAHSFCVTNAMKLDLAENWGVRATVLYDRPPEIFKPITLREKHNWFLKLGSLHPEFLDHDARNVEQSEISQTAFTFITNGDVKSRNNRPGLLFSSTSWTPDEDFAILLHALQVYETSYDTMKNLPKLICVITGKGPMKQHYIDVVATKQWKHVKVITPWLESQDYPKMVASADLGVCLHTSSSGLDLPMKVVDMFGAGLPVCAFNYKCLNELVKHEENGYTFHSINELSEQIMKWFVDFPNIEEQNQTHRRMKDELKKFQKLRWENNWNEKARKYFFL